MMMIHNIKIHINIKFFAHRIVVLFKLLRFQKITTVGGKRVKITISLIVHRDNRKTLYIH